MVRSLEEFDFALRMILKEKKYDSLDGSLLGPIASRTPDERNKVYNELKQEFCKRYNFTEELFEVALDGWGSWIDVKIVNDILKDSKYRKKSVK